MGTYHANRRRYLSWAYLATELILDADYYSRTTNDLLLQAPIPWSAGFTTANVYKNVGSVRNSGVELSLNTVNVKSNSFQWTTTFLFAANKNKVLKLNDGNADIFPGPNFLGQNYVIRVGQPIRFILWNDAFRYL
jgi:hypothetical protein